MASSPSGPIVPDHRMKRHASTRTETSNKTLMKNSSTGAVAPIQVTENDIKKFYTDLLEGGDPTDWDRKSQTCIRGAIDFHADLHRLKSAQVQVAYAVERLV